MTYEDAHELELKLTKLTFDPNTFLEDLDLAPNSFLTFSILINLTRF